MRHSDVVPDPRAPRPPLQKVLAAMPRSPLVDPDASLADTLAALRRLRSRRHVLQGALAAVIGAPLSAFAAACREIPSATAGPFPANGTNGPNVLSQSGIVRADIRPSFGAAGADVAPGTPLALTLQIVNARADCAPLAGRAVYVWHCDAAGRYSLYSGGATRENYLRGVQITDADGRVTFSTIFPGCYPGRWPHVHFEVYASAAHASAGTAASKTSQLAFPESASREVYAQASLYPRSASYLSRMTLASDGVFADGGAHQLATVAGTAARGLTAQLQVGLAS